MQHSLLNRLIEDRDGLSVNLLGGLLVALGDSLPQFTKLGAEARGVRAVGGCAPIGLAGALQRRKMICHGWFITFVYLEDIRGGSESLL